MNETAHLYLWVPNALLPDGLAVMEAWGFTYKTNIVWHKIRKDGGSDGRGVGFYFRNVTELVLLACARFALLTYGGVSLFVVVFAVYPFALQPKCSGEAKFLNA
jgi:hypothetical protein